VEKAKAVLVMRRIGVEPTGNSTSRESGQTSTRCLNTRESVKSVKEARQMTANPIAGAASHKDVDWHAIHWQQAHETVRRLQARIVKATCAAWRHR
jgi:hypothetical protein